MTEYGFFTSMDGDRVYSDADFANYYKDLVSSGVILTSSAALQVNADSGMTLRINDGGAMLEGRWFRSKNNETVVVPNANGVNPRLDRVVIRCDYVQRSVYFTVITGTPASNPQPPPVVRDGACFDIALATVSVSAGAVSLTQAMIFDTRDDEDVCGFVTGLIKQIDATSFFAQFNAQWKEFISSLQGGDNVNVNISIADAQLLDYMSAYNVWLRNINLNKLKVGLS